MRLLSGRGRDAFASRMYVRAMRAWRRYSERMQAMGAGTNDVELDAEFASSGFRVGHLTPHAAARLNRALESATASPFQKRAVRWTYFYPAGSDELKINANNTFFDLRHDQLDAVEATLRTIQPVITACMGSGWRVVNSRYWSTRATDQPHAGNAWHADGMPEAFLKLMIYPDGASEALGTTELIDGAGNHRRIEGPPGVWMLFKNSVLQHRGLPAESGRPRRIVELTIVPSNKTIVRPVSAGANAQYPFLPWLH